MPRKGENIYKRKDGRWEGRYIRSYDSEHKAKYAYVYGKTYSEVKRKLTEQRGNVQKVQPTKNKSSTYGELLDCWLHSMQLNTKESTQARYTHLIKTHIKPHLGAVQLSQLTTDAIEIFIEQQLTDGRLDNSGGLSPKTVTDILSQIQAIPQEEVQKVLGSINKSGRFGTRQNVSSVSIVPSTRDEDKERFVQGIEKFIDTMKGSEYTAVFIAEPLDKEILEQRKRGLQKIYSGLSPFASTQLSYGENYSKF